MRLLLAWLADLTLGTQCRYGCGHRDRDTYSRACHEAIDHCGDQ